MKVRVLQLGRRVIDHPTHEDATLASILEEIGVDPRGMDLRVNGESAGETTILKENDVITVIPRIKGG